MISELVATLEHSEQRTHHREEGRQALEYLERLDCDLIIEAVVSHWNDVVSSGAQFSAKPIAAKHDLQMPDDLRDALQGDSSNRNRLASRAAKVLLARATGRFLAAQPPKLALLTAVASVERCLSWETLLTEFAQHLGESNAWRPWLIEFTTKGVTLDPGNDERDNFVEQQALWMKERLSPFPRWHRGHVMMNSESDWFLAFALLRHIDEREWLAALEAVGQPNVIETLLETYSLSQDPEALARLVRLAPPAFDTNARRTGTVVVYILARLALDLGVEVLDRVGTRERFADQDQRPEWERLAASARDATVPAWYQRVASTIADREDGHSLLVEFGAEYIYLAYRSQLQSATLIDRFKEYHRIADALTLPLLRDAGSMAWVKGRWEVREEFARDGQTSGELKADGLPYWLFAVSLEHERLGSSPSDARPLDPGVASELWTWLTRLLVERDPSLGELWGVGASPPWVQRSCGYVFASLGMRLEDWRRTWDLLQVQRFDASRRDTETKLWSPSRFLVATAIQSLPFGATETFGAKAEIAPLWRQAMRCAIHLWLRTRDKQAHGEFKLALCMLVVLGATISDEPGASLRYLFGESEKALDVAEALVLNGADVATVDRWFLEVGIDIPAYETLVPSRGGKLDDVARTRREFAQAILVARRDGQGFGGLEA